MSENLLEQRFQASAPSQVWLTDITYIPTDEGWLYLVGPSDAYTRKIVGYAMGHRMTKNLVNQSLFHAVATKRPAPGLIHHSDRGSQYCAQEFLGLIDRFGMSASMSGKGNCYEKAPMESFWGTLKTELVFQRRFKTWEEAIREITEYIELFYNRQRVQKKLDSLSPAAFENRFYQLQRAA